MSEQPDVPDGVQPTDAQQAERSADTLDAGPVTPGRGEDGADHDDGAD